VDENELKTLLAKLFDSIVTDLTSHKLANRTAQREPDGPAQRGGGDTVTGRIRLTYAAVLPAAILWLLKASTLKVLDTGALSTK
jgi:hypothetical protein